MCYALAVDELLIAKQCWVNDRAGQNTTGTTEDHEVQGLSEQNGYSPLCKNKEMVVWTIGEIKNSWVVKRVNK